jgi:hypothetical protein
MQTGRCTWRFGNTVILLFRRYIHQRLEELLQDIETRSSATWLLIIERHYMTRCLTCQRIASRVQPDYAFPSLVAAIHGI